MPSTKLVANQGALSTRQEHPTGDTYRHTAVVQQQRYAFIPSWADLRAETHGNLHTGRQGPLLLGDAY